MPGVWGLRMNKTQFLFPKKFTVGIGTAVILVKDQTWKCVYIPRMRRKHLI